MPNYVKAEDQLTIEDYPIGGGQRGQAIYTIETKNGKQRFCRITEKRNGGFSKPKTTTYSLQCKILTCDENKTWLATKTGYGFYKIMQSNMKYDEESIFEDNEKFQQMNEFFQN